MMKYEGYYKDLELDLFYRTITQTSVRTYGTDSRKVVSLIRKYAI